MSRKIFRKKSLDKLNAPETLDECIKVTNPGVWLILTAAVLLLVGACIWGVFGHIDSTASASVIAENGTLTGTLAEENAAAVEAGMTVHFAEYEATVESIGKKEGRYVCTFSANGTVPDGIYDGKITVQSFTPFSFILN